jgi:hypothetical protein
MELGAGLGSGRRVLGSNPGKDKIFLSCPKRPELRWGPFSLLFNGFRGSYSGVERPRHEGNHLTSVEVMNEWSYTSTPPT